MIIFARKHEKKIFNAQRGGHKEKDECLWICTFFPHSGLWLTLNPLAPYQRVQISPTVQMYECVWRWIGQRPRSIHLGLAGGELKGGKRQVVIGRGEAGDR